MTNVQTDKQKVRAAFRQLRKEGFVARMGISNDPEVEEGTNVVWYQRYQNDFFDYDGNIERVVFLSWDGDAKRIVEVMEEHGLKAVWEGKFHHAIEIFSEHTKH